MWPISIFITLSSYLFSIFIKFWFQIQVLTFKKLTEIWYLYNSSHSKHTHVWHKLIASDLNMRILVLYFIPPGFMKQTTLKPASHWQFQKNRRVGSWGSIGWNLLRLFSTDRFDPAARPLDQIFAINLRVAIVNYLWSSDPSLICQTTTSQLRLLFSPDTSSSTGPIFHPIFHPTHRSANQLGNGTPAKYQLLSSSILNSIYLNLLISYFIGNIRIDRLLKRKIS